MKSDFGPLTDKQKMEWKNNQSNPHAPGAKLDNDKPDMDLVLGAFSRALIEVGNVGTFGAKKYSENGWLKVPSGFRRYTSAMLRHYTYEEIDGKFDKESNLYHAAHLAWNALARLELLIRDEESKVTKPFIEVGNPNEFMVKVNRW